MAGSLFTLDQLPFDCLYCICDYLTAEDLSRFSRACMFFYNVASSESLWRQQCLSRWQFCDVQQISSGEQRWRRYFLARRKVEASMEQGRPMRDYRVKSLRAHEQDIINVVTVGGSSIDWEHPLPPVIVSLSEDGVVHAWDATEGKPVFSLEHKTITCLAGDEQNNEVAVGNSDGHVTVYRTADWSVKTSLIVPTEKTTVHSLQYGRVNRSRGLPQSVLMVSAQGIDSGDTLIALWDTTSPANPLALLSVDLTSFEGSPLILNLSPSGWLAASTVSTSCVYVWMLSSIVSSSPSPAQISPLPLPSPSLPLVTLHLENVSTPPFIWLRTGVLATCSRGQVVVRQRHPHHQFHQLHHTHQTSTMSVWNVAKYAEEQKKGQSFQVNHLYDSKSVSLESPPTVIAYSHGVLVTGDEAGFVRIIDPDSGKVISKFKDHLGPVTDLYADRFRVLSCSRDYSIRVYRWKRVGQGSKSYPQLESRYQLLGGSVAHKTHNGFHQVTCKATCCVGVAGNIIKLYNFANKLPSAS